MGSSVGFTLPYFELPERGCVLAPKGATTLTLLLLAEQLGSKVITLKLVARIAVRLVITQSFQNFQGYLRSRIPRKTGHRYLTLAQVRSSRNAVACSRASTVLRAQTSTQMLRTSNSMTTIPNTSTANATASYSSQIGMIAPHVPLPTDLQNGLLRLPNRYRRAAVQLAPSHQSPRQACLIVTYDAKTQPARRKLEPAIPKNSCDPYSAGTQTASKRAVLRHTKIARPI
jgi:hypothetical protein